MNLINWTSFSEIETLLGQVARGPRYLSVKKPPANVHWRPASAIVENQKEYIISTDVPSVKREDVNVYLDDGVLIIEGERKIEKSADDEKEHRREYYRGNFSRRFLLPDDADASGISAECRDGVLRVLVPKAKEQKAKSVAITVN